MSLRSRSQYAQVIAPRQHPSHAARHPGLGGTGLRFFEARVVAPLKAAARLK